MATPWENNKKITKTLDFNRASKLKKNYHSPRLFDHQRREVFTPSAACSLPPTPVGFGRRMPHPGTAHSGKLVGGTWLGVRSSGKLFRALAYYFASHCAYGPIFGVQVRHVTDGHGWRQIPPHVSRRAIITNYPDLALADSGGNYRLRLDSRHGVGSDSGVI